MLCRRSDETSLNTSHFSYNAISSWFGFHFAHFHSYEFDMSHIICGRGFFFGDHFQQILKLQTSSRSMEVIRKSWNFSSIWYMHFCLIHVLFYHTKFWIMIFARLSFYFAPKPLKIAINFILKNIDLDWNDSFVKNNTYAKHTR